MADREAFISDKDIMHSPTSWRKVTLKDSSASGKVRAVKANGKTVSIQPDGREEERDGGQDGGYEQGKLVGDTRLVYAYGDSKQPAEFRVILL